MHVLLALALMAPAPARRYPGALESRLVPQARCSHILLDPRGTVLSIGGKDQLPLHGERLMESLARLLEDGRR
jgi:hypothetical protein